MRSIDDSLLILINQKICSRYNQESKVINYSNLSSCFSIFNSYYETEEQIASAFFRAIITGHPFQDGNKRTACVALWYLKPGNISARELAEIAVETAKKTNVDVDELVKNIYKVDLNESQKPTYTFSYKGPVYRFNKIYTVLKEPIYVIADNINHAYTLLTGKLKKQNNFSYNSNLTIDKDDIIQVTSDPFNYEVIEDNPIKKEQHKESDYIYSINNHDIYFENGYYKIDDLPIKFISEEDIRDYLEESYMNLNEKMLTEDSSTYTVFFCESDSDGNPTKFDTYHVMAESDDEALRKAMGTLVGEDEEDEAAVIDTLSTYGYSLDADGVREYLENIALTSIYGIIYGIKDSNGNLILDNNFDYYDGIYNGESPVKESLSYNQIIEKLNEIDRRCIDEDLKFYDVKTLFEDISTKLTPQDKEEIKKIIQTTDDAETIAAVINSKTKKESLDEDAEGLDISDYTQLSSSIRDGGDVYALFRKVEDGKSKWAAAKYVDGSPDIDNAFEITYEQARGQAPLSRIGEVGRELGKKLLPNNINEASYGGAYDVEDEMYFTKDDIVDFADLVVERLEKEFDKSYQITDLGFNDPTHLYIELEDTEGYSFDYELVIDMRKIRKPRDIYKYADMVTDYFKNRFKLEYDFEETVPGNYNESLNESASRLNNREKQIYIDALKEAEDREDLEDIVHEIFFYDKGLFVLLRHFPKEMSFEDLRDKLIEIIQSTILDESLNEKLVDVSDDLQKEFEELFDKNGWKIEDKGNTFMGNIHYQIISTGHPIEEKDLKNYADSLIKDIDVFSKKYDIPVTWNFGLNNEYMPTAGIDIYKQYVKESLNESATSNLRDKIIDCLDWFILMEMEFPKDQFLADSWEDLKDGIEMGLDPEFETAEGIVEYLKPIISFNKHYTKEVEDEGVFQDEIDMYRSLIRAMNIYLKDQGYDATVKE